MEETEACSARVSTLSLISPRHRQSGEPSFSLQCGSDYKEFPAGLRRSGRLQSRARQVLGLRAQPAAFGNGGHVRGRVFAHQRSQTALRNDTFVVVSRHERKKPIELRTAISSFVSGPVTVMGSVKSRRPPGFSSRVQSAITRGRLGR
jgi:hypothetical protein